MSTDAQQSLIQALRHSLAHSLENMVFFETIASDADALSVPDQDWFHIRITSPIEGALTLWGASELFAAMAAQLFGDLPPNLAPQAAQDAGCELANTVAGHLLACLLSEQTFALSLPQSGSGQPPADQAVHTHIACEVEGMPLHVLVSGEGLLGLAEALPTAGKAEDVSSDAWGDPFHEADHSWGRGPEPDSETGRWPAGTSVWGKEGSP